jgi:hypothetical protein
MRGRNPSAVWARIPGGLAYQTPAHKIIRERPIAINPRGLGTASPDLRKTPFLIFDRDLATRLTRFLHG